MTNRTAPSTVLFLAASVASAQAPDFEAVRRMMPGDSRRALTGDVGDVDGDGDPDLLTGCEGEDGLYSNDGWGRYVDASATLPPDASETQSVTLVDLDGDGALDAYLGKEGPDRLLLGDGAGGFVDASAMLPVLPAGLVLAADVADVDGDGDLDVALAVFGQDHLLLNDGAAGLSEAGPFGHVNGSSSLELGDVDGDGDPDVLACVPDGPAAPQGVLLLENDGAGAFTDISANMPFTEHGTFDSCFFDADGDGALDVALRGPLELFLYLGDGAGGFTDGSGALPMLDDVGRVTSLDADGDGDQDLLHRTGSGMELLANDGSGAFTSSPLPPVASVVAEMLPADVDADGDADVLFAGFPTNRVWLGDDTGAFVDVTEQDPFLTFYSRVLALGDVDGDGSPDLFLGTGAVLPFGISIPNQLFLGDGTGRLTEAPGAIPSDPIPTEDAELVDLDGDGDRDAFLAVGGQNQLYLGDGQGSFVATVGHLPAEVEASNALAIADVDLDGDLDALVGNSSSGGSQNRLYANDGAGLFSEVPAALPAVADATRVLAVADLDLDGDPEVFVGNDGPDRLLRNVAGTFADLSANLPAIDALTRDAAFLDADGDGDQDLVVGGEQGETLLVNGGGASFAVAAGQVPGGGAECLALAVGDLDGDGDVDLFVGRDGPNEVFLNDGAGAFTSGGPLPGVGEYTEAVSLADVDLDGDLDLVLGGGWILANTTRQLAQRGAPRVGKPYELALRGSPSAPWVLGFALAPGSFPVPAFGELRLDLASLSVLGSGTFDAAGETVLQLPGPASPTWIGTSLYWQALAGSPLRFTGLERTTFTGL